MGGAAEVGAAVWPGRNQWSAVKVAKAAAIIVSLDLLHWRKVGSRLAESLRLEIALECMRNPRCFDCRGAGSVAF